MSTLEKENDYKDEYFDFMQHHLRKFCLECKNKKSLFSLNHLHLFRWCCFILYICKREKKY